MDRVAQLAAEAEGLRRNFWASLPWSVRLAEVFTILAEAQNEPFSRTMAAMFLLAGVTGMPPIKGEKPEDFMAAFQAKHGHNAWGQQVKVLTASLPHGYAGVIGGAAFKQALAVTRNNLAVAEDLMGEVLIKFLAGAGQHLRPEPFGTAIKFVQTSVRNLGINVGQKGKREVGPGKDPDTGESNLAPDATSVHSLEEMARKYADILVREIHSPKVKADLEHIHPEAVKYIEMLLDGKSDVEILGTNAKRETVGEPLLKHNMVSPKGDRMYPALWNATYKKKIFDVIRKHLPDLTYGLGRGEHHTMYSYDRRASGT